MNQANDTNGKKVFPKRWLWLLLAAAVCAAALWACTSLVASGGRLYWKGRQELDLREEDISVEEYLELSQALPDCRIRWSIPIGEGRYDSDARSITVTDFTPEEAPLFLFFQRLESVDASGCTCYGALLEAQELLEDCRFTWSLPLGEMDYSWDALYVRVSLDEIGIAELAELLAYMPRLRVVRLADGFPTQPELEQLQQALPELTFFWSVELLGETYDCSLETLSLAGREDLTEASLEEIRLAAARFRRLQEVDLTGCGFSNDQLLALQEALPETDIRWTFDLCGVTVCSLDREIDLSRRTIRDPAVVEQALPYLRYVEKIDMSRCGLTDETMDALNKKYQDIRFVWTVFFSCYSLRTDATSFIAAMYYDPPKLYNSDVRCLQYCTDLVGLDLGHMEITDLSFLYSLPKLRYLIMVENPIRDITPIGSLKELEYLEIFWTKVEDLSPLKNCTNLLDLNICYIYSKPDAAFEVLMDMPWLERLWYCGNSLSEEQLAALQAQMPQCEMYMGAHDESTGGTWRYHPRYYEMRDCFGMYYMEGGTNGVAADGSQIVYG